MDVILRRKTEYDKIVFFEETKRNALIIHCKMIKFIVANNNESARN